MLSRKEPDLEHLKNSQSIHIAKKEKMTSGGNTRSVAGHSINSLPMDLISHLNWSQYQMGLTTEKLPAGTKGNTENGEE